MKILNLFVFALLLIVALPSYAAPVDREKAIETALNFDRQRYGNVSARSSEKALKLVYTSYAAESGRDGSDFSARSAASAVNYYVFNREENDGFIIVAGDDCARPVLGYSDKGAYVAGAVPPPVEMWLGKYAAQIAAAVESGAVPSAEIQALWNNLGKSGPAEPAVVMNTAEWGQGTPYNNLIPGKPLTGCGPTAMAIVMHYLKWARQGSGSHSYNYEGTTYSADFETTYDWDNMLYAYKDVPYTQPQAEAVAKLMYNCGVSVEAEYSPTLTTAKPFNMASALVTYLGGDRDILCEQKSAYTLEQWETLIGNELSAGRPLIYHGSSPAFGGHAFVFDGYDTAGNFHVNWGWDGDLNGYFPVDALVPEPAITFVEDEGLIYRIKEAQNPVSENRSELQLYNLEGGEGMLSGEEDVVKDEEFMIKVGLLGNAYLTPYTGKIAIALTTAGGTVKEIVSNKISLKDFLTVGEDALDYYFLCRVTSDMDNSDLLRTVSSVDGQNWKIVRAGNAFTVDSIKVKGHNVVWHNVSLPEMEGVEIIGDEDFEPGKVVHGFDYMFDVIPSQSDVIVVVKANGEQVAPDEDDLNSYTLESVGEDVDVTVTLYDASLRNKTLSLEAGKLEESLTDDERWYITGLTLTGTINQADFTVLKEMPQLENIDLSGATVVALDTYEANTIPLAAFHKKETVKLVRLPASLRKIGDGAFARCINLDNVIIPEGVTEIRPSAFLENTSMHTLTVLNPVPVEIEESVFGEMSLGECVLKVPYGKKTAYENASVWNRFGRIEELPDQGTAVEDAADDKARCFFSNGVLTVENRNDRPLHIVVSDAGGRICYDAVVAETKVEIPLVTKGVYVVSLDGKNGKIIINN